MKYIRSHSELKNCVTFSNQNHSDRHYTCRGTAGDYLDNRAAVGAAKELDAYFQNHVENILTRISNE